MNHDQAGAAAKGRHESDSGKKVLHESRLLRTRPGQGEGKTQPMNCGGPEAGTKMDCAALVLLKLVTVGQF